MSFLNHIRDVLFVFMISSYSTCSYMGKWVCFLVHLYTKPSFSYRSFVVYFSISYGKFISFLSFPVCPSAFYFSSKRI